MAKRSSCRVVRRCRSNTIFCSRAKNDSVAALSPHAPTRPKDPVNPWLLSVLTNAVEPNWDPRSEFTTVPSGDLRAAALRSAETPAPLHSGINGIANDSVRIDVLDRAQVQLALVGAVLGNVCEP